MAYYHAAAGAALALACASTPSVDKADERVYLASAETTRSETDVTVCARTRTTTSPMRNGSIENTAYGRGPVSDHLSFRAYRADNRTVLMVTARSYVFPESGRGEGNSNTVLIPVSDQAKDRVNQIIKFCTEDPS